MPLLERFLYFPKREGVYPYRGKCEHKSVQLEQQPTLIFGEIKRIPDLPFPSLDGLQHELVLGFVEPSLPVEAVCGTAILCVSHVELMSWLAAVKTLGDGKDVDDRTKVFILSTCTAVRRPSPHCVWLSRHSIRQGSGKPYSMGLDKLAIDASGMRRGEFENGIAGGHARGAYRAPSPETPEYASRLLLELRNCLNISYLLHHTENRMQPQSLDPSLA
jgi:hypothetical protein